MTEKKAKKFLLSLAQEWSLLFGLDDWTVKYEWHTGAIPEAGAATVMSTTANWSYKWATIQVSLAAVREQSKRELEMQFFHECCHILCRVLPLPGKKGRVCSEEERFCTDFGQMIQRIVTYACARGAAAEAEARATHFTELAPVQDPAVVAAASTEFDNVLRKVLHA